MTSSALTSYPQNLEDSIAVTKCQSFNIMTVQHFIVIVESFLALNAVPAGTRCSQENVDK